MEYVTSSSIRELLSKLDPNWRKGNHEVISDGEANKDELEYYGGRLVCETVHGFNLEFISHAPRIVKWLLDTLEWTILNYDVEALLKPVTLSDGEVCLQMFARRVPGGSSADVLKFFGAENGVIEMVGLIKMLESVHQMVRDRLEVTEKRLGQLEGECHYYISKARESETELREYKKLMKVRLSGLDVELDKVQEWTA